MIVHFDEHGKHFNREKEMIGDVIILSTCLTPTIFNLLNVTFHSTSFLTIERDQVCKDHLFARSVSQMINFGS